MFSRTVTGHWMPGVAATAAAAGSPDETVVVIDPALSDSRALSVLTLPDARAILTLTPHWAHTLGVGVGDILDTSRIDDRLRVAGVPLNDPDALHYLPSGTTRSGTAPSATAPSGTAPSATAPSGTAPSATAPSGTAPSATAPSGTAPSATAPSGTAASAASDDRRSTRRLTDEDADAFAGFASAAPADDLDEAFVELDHWLAYGTFVDGELVAAASAYPWAGSLLADIGVITLPASRGRGLGRDTVRAISAAARALGYEPQYRCQLDNAASVALAETAGFVHFGQWRVILPAADSTA